LAIFIPDFLFINEKNIPKKLSGIIISQIPVLPFQENNNKKLIKIYMGHGVSDKKFSATQDILNAKAYDYYFLSGPKDFYRLNQIIDDKEELKKRTIKIGLLRGDEIINKTLDIDYLKTKYNVDNDKKTILYCPTWKFGDGTLKQCFINFTESISKEYNLIIRPHYFDYRLFRIHKKFIKSNRLGNVKYITISDLNINELFTISDLLIADNSSIDY